MREGFRKLNSDLIKAATFSDVEVREGVDYFYVVTAVNIDNVEGMPSVPYMLSLAEAPIYPPSGVAVRTTSSGIIIDWGKSLHEHIEGYEILRRTETEDTPSVVGKVSADDESFTDKAATAGKLYFYSVKATAGTKISERSDEVSIRP